MTIPPTPPTNDLAAPTDTNGEAAESAPSAPTLTSIRASLLPDNCQSARFTTHSGPDSKLVSGTIYVGSHPGEEERILWLQMGQNSPRLYPTVYTLWHNPGLVPLLHTAGFVVGKLQTGADLMTPGLAGGPPFPERATKNAIVAVASIEAPTVPKVVGSCEIDVSQLQQVQGAKGHAVSGVHWEGDEIWAWSQTGTGGRPSPTDIEAWAIKDVKNGLQSLTLEEEDDEDGEDGGASLEEATGDTNGKMAEDVGEVVERREPTTQEIDRAFHDAFLYAVYDAKNKGQPPNYGIDFPIQPSFLISQMIQPRLPIFTPDHAQHYTIKKTSWKTTKKFIKHLDKEVLVKSKDRDRNETVILDIDFDDRQITEFTPYKIPKAKAVGGGGKESSTQPGSDPSIGQSIRLQQLYRPSSKLIPDLLPSKTDYYTGSQISSYIHTYIQNHPEITKETSSHRFVKLDPFLANNFFSGSHGAADSNVLAAGEVTRDALLRRFLDDQVLCVPHWVLLRGDQQWDLAVPNLPKPKSGHPPKVSIGLEKRTGTKTVSKIGNVEVFGISPELLAAELQKKCASSTSVGQLVGGKPGMMEILVQGDQRATIEKELGKRGVAPKWIEVQDKTKKKGGGGGGGGRR